MQSVSRPFGFANSLELIRDNSVIAHRCTDTKCIQIFSLCTHTAQLYNSTILLLATFYCIAVVVVAIAIVIAPAVLSNIKTLVFFASILLIAMFSFQHLLLFLYSLQFISVVRYLFLCCSRIWFLYSRGTVCRPNWRRVACCRVNVVLTMLIFIYICVYMYVYM